MYAHSGFPTLQQQRLKKQNKVDKPFTRSMQVYAGI